MSRIRVMVLGATTGAEMEAAVDEDLMAYNEFFQKHLGNQPLSGFEVAALKTWLAWKLRVEAKDVPGAAATSASPEEGAGET